MAFVTHPPQFTKAVIISCPSDFRRRKKDKLIVNNSYKILSWRGVCIAAIGNVLIFFERFERFRNWSVPWPLSDVIPKGWHSCSFTKSDKRMK